MILFTQWPKTIPLLPCIILYPSATLDIFDYGILLETPSTHVSLTAHSLEFHWLLLNPCCSSLYWYTSDEYRSPWRLNLGTTALFLPCWFNWPFGYKYPLQVDDSLNSTCRPNSSLFSSLM